MKTREKLDEYCDLLEEIIRLRIEYYTSSIKRKEAFMIAMQVIEDTESEQELSCKGNRLAKLQQTMQKITHAEDLMETFRDDYERPSKFMQSSMNFF